MKLKNILLSIVTIWGVSSPLVTVAQEGRNVSEYNLPEDKIGLKGFDPVAVFPEGGGQAAQGSVELAHDHSGVVYYFKTNENRELFVSNPEKYEPTYGGWCAYAMANGSYVDIKPEIFTVIGNRAYYFVANRAKRNFDQNISNYEQRADTHWKQFSGEDPRK